MIGISDAQRAALTSLAPSLDPGTYLAGGVALATVYGHRRSRDLDLFVPSEFDPERLEERLAASSDGAHAVVTGRARGTLHLEVCGVPASILSYRYPLLGPLRASAELSVPAASVDDLACMKVSAIAGRGAAKDFWDLHVILERAPSGVDLATLLEQYARKYAIEDIGHAVRAMAYFADADAAPLPIGLSAEAWSEIKTGMAARVLALR